MEEGVKKEEPSSFAKASEDKLQELEKKCDEYLNNWKRERADFLNYKRDEAERMAFLGNYAKEDMILKILPIIDNIILAEEQLPEKLKKGLEGSKQSIEWTKGFLQIQNQIEDFLRREGVVKIETIGKQFDPETMEVVEEVEIEKNPSTGSRQVQPNIVIEEVQRGYKIDEKVLRPAKVKVTK